MTKFYNIERNFIEFLHVYNIIYYVSSMISRIAVFEVWIQYYLGYIMRFETYVMNLTMVKREDIIKQSNVITLKST